MTGGLLNNRRLSVVLIGALVAVASMINGTNGQSLELGCPLKVKCCHFKQAHSSSYVTHAEIEQVLRLWGFARNKSRRSVAPPGLAYIFSECFGLV